MCRLSLFGGFRRVHHRQWCTAAYLEAWSTTTSKLAAAPLCLEQVHLLQYVNIRAEEAHRWQSQVHAITLAALHQTTLWDLPWVAFSSTMRHAKRPGDDTQTVAHKRRKTKWPPELEVPADLHDMEIPLEDMGDVIVVTEL